jgi:hypothetical protein
MSVTTMSSDDNAFSRTTAHSSSPAPADPQVPAAHQLDLALATATAFQQATQQADGKANVLLALQAGAFALFVSSLHGVGTYNPAWRVGVLVIFLSSSVVAGYFTAQSIRPRLTPTPSRSRFSFPDVARHGISPSSADCLDQLVVEAWDMVETVARIASVKNRYLNRGLLPMAAMIVSATVLLLGT